jgi:hypothetical protein
MIRKSGGRFSEKIMLKQKMALEHDSTRLKHALAIQLPLRNGLSLAGKGYDMAFWL